MKTAFHVLILSLLVAGPAFAAGDAGKLNIKLVAAKSSNGGVDEGLKGVSGLLQGNFSFGSYSLLAQKTVPMAANKRIILAEGVVVALSDIQGNSLKIRIDKGKKKILDARINLRKEKPAIFGGFSGSKGKMMVILTLL